MDVRVFAVDHIADGAIPAVEGHPCLQVGAVFDEQATQRRALARAKARNQQWWAPVELAVGRLAGTATGRARVLLGARGDGDREIGVGADVEEHAHDVDEVVEQREVQRGEPGPHATRRAPVHVHSRKRNGQEVEADGVDGFLLEPRADVVHEVEGRIRRAHERTHGHRGVAGTLHTCA